MGETFQMHNLNYEGEVGEVNWYQKENYPRYYLEAQSQQFTQLNVLVSIFNPVLMQHLKLK